MPRHPPCALHSLSHKHNTTTTTTKTRTDTHTPDQPTPRRRDGLVRRAYGIGTRCSRPLCRSQTTNPPRTTHTPSRCAGAQGGPKTHTPPNRKEPDPSGPNRVPTPTPPATAPGSTPTPARRPRRTVLRHDHHQGRSFIDDSTSEHHQCQPHVRWLRGVCAP